MRKISKLAARAFIEGREFRRDNTEVVVCEVIHCKRKELRLHGNVIARQTSAARGYQPLKITLAGWPTPTTRERLNTLLTEMGKREGVWQHNHEQYYGTLEGSRIISENEWITVT